MSTPPLLGTKLRAPVPRRGAVARPRLDRGLDGPDRPALTLVSAPAGFGKTTLLARWLAAEDRPVAWLALDERDDDPARFLAYLLAAVDAAAPGAAAAATALLGATPSAVEAVVATLLNDLAARPGELVVVLDDYHVVTAPALHEAMAALVEHLPPQVRLVVATRADPPLPLARLRARGELREVRAADLRFTADETARYLTGAMGLALADADVAALGARTEGWIAALQLAALSLRDREDAAGFVASFAGDDRFVLDYLVEEVLDRQPAGVRDFLLRTSVLGRLTGSLCDAVTGAAGGQATLEALDRANLFLVPLDDRRRWYRYHHLFGDVLRARLLGEHPDLVAGLHRRAGAWHEDHGDRAEAIDHALAGGDHDRAARLVEGAAGELRRTRQEAALRRWVEALPPAVLADRPVLGIALVGGRMATGDPTGVDALLDDVARWLDPAPGREPIVVDEDEWARLPAQVEVYRAGLALLAGDVDATLAHATRAAALAPPAEHVQQGSAAALLGLASWRRGDLDAARTRYAEAVDHLAAAGFVADELGCRLALADILLAQGRLGEAQRTFEDGLAHARAHPGLRGTADMHAGLAELAIERDELDRAERHLAAAHDLGPHAGLPQHPYRVRVAEARVRSARGDHDGALLLLAEAEEVVATDYSPPVRPIPALVARVHLARGDVEAARAWSRASGLAADDTPDLLHEVGHLTLARVLLAEGDDRSTARALALLERLRAAAEDGGRTGSLVEVLVLLAAAHRARGDGAAATAALERAVAVAAPEGFRRALVDDGPIRRPAAPSPSALSDREHDVLRLLRGDLSGPDIARELHVSLNTLRTHTRNVYAKLGVTSRREAVRRAAELGL